jgi:hypothetical protein
MQIFANGYKEKGTHIRCKNIHKWVHKLFSENDTNTLLNYMPKPSLNIDACTLTLELNFFRFDLYHVISSPKKP